MATMWRLLVFHTSGSGRTSYHTSYLTSLLFVSSLGNIELQNDVLMQSCTSASVECIDWTRRAAPVRALSWIGQCCGIFPRIGMATPPREPIFCLYLCSRPCTKHARKVTRKAIANRGLQIRMRQYMNAIPWSQSCNLGTNFLLTFCPRNTICFGRLSI